MFQREIFFDTIRNSVGLTEVNVPGFDRIIDYGIARGYDREKLAYATATAYWESGKTMRPVKEAYWLSEDWRRKNLRYFPWYGRGLIQTTWQGNYVAVAVLLGLPDDFFTKDPDKLLEWEYALPALFVAMEQGIYTGKDFDDYIDGIDESDDEDLREYANARRIVNGTDKQIEIGKIALAIEKGLKAAGYPDNGPQPEPAKPVEPEIEDYPELPELPGGEATPEFVPPGFWETVLDIITDLIASLFKRKP